MCDYATRTSGLAARRRGRRLACLLMVLVCFVILFTGCGSAGSSGKGSSTVATQASVHAASGSDSSEAISTTSHRSHAVGRPHPKDADGDTDSSHPSLFDYDDTPVGGYGHGAGRRDRRAIEDVVKRYYADAGSKNGVRACADIGKALALSVSELYGQTKSRGKTGCASAMSRVLTTYFGSTGATLSAIIDVRVSGAVGLVVILTGAGQVRQTLVERESGAWKTAAFVDTELP